MTVEARAEYLLSEIQRLSTRQETLLRDLMAVHRALRIGGPDRREIDKRPRGRPLGRPRKDFPGGGPTGSKRV